MKNLPLKGPLVYCAYDGAKDIWLELKPDAAESNNNVGRIAARNLYKINGNRQVIITVRN
jgi:hypothetical protein